MVIMKKLDLKSTSSFIVCFMITAMHAPVFTCNLKAISLARRPHYNDLFKRLLAAVRGRNEILNGYALNLDAKAITLSEVAEWISLERLCCPFLTLTLKASGNQPDWTLTLTGPPGVKAILDAEFHSR